MEDIQSVLDRKLLVMSKAQTNNRLFVLIFVGIVFE